MSLVVSPSLPSARRCLYLHIWKANLKRVSSLAAYFLSLVGVCVSWLGAVPSFKALEVGLPPAGMWSVFGETCQAPPRAPSSLGGERAVAKTEPYNLPNKQERGIATSVVPGCGKCLQLPQSRSPSKIQTWGEGGVRGESMSCS